MGGPKQAFKTLVNTAVGKNIIKPVTKTPEEGKKTSNALDDKLAENAEEGNEAAAKILTKRKGRRKTIINTASGLNDDEEIKKKTLLG